MSLVKCKKKMTTNYESDLVVEDDEAVTYTFKTKVSIRYSINIENWLMIKSTKSISIKIK